jgi:hypothetical protein
MKLHAVTKKIFAMIDWLWMGAKSVVHLAVDSLQIIDATLMDNGLRPGCTNAG